MLLTNKYGLPQSIFDAINNDPYDGPGADLSSISVTTLINPPKIRQLKLRHNAEITEDVSENIWRLLGSSVHSVLERVTDAGRLIEERLTLKVGNKTLSGKTDIYEAAECCIQDYKVTSAWSIVYSPEGKKEWEAQLNCLCLLYRKSGFEVKKLKIIAILRDWSKANALKDSSYPQIPIVVIDISLWDEAKQMAYVQSKVLEHASFDGVTDDSIPECTPEDRWQSTPKFAVYKNSNVRATKVFDAESDAIAFAATQNAKDSYRVESRPGVDKRCTEYCSVNKFCHYWKAKYQNAEAVAETV